MTQVPFIIFLRGGLVFSQIYEYYYYESLRLWRLVGWLVVMVKLPPEEWYCNARSNSQTQTEHYYSRLVITLLRWILRWILVLGSVGRAGGSEEIVCLWMGYELDEMRCWFKMSVNYWVRLNRRKKKEKNNKWMNRLMEHEIILLKSFFIELELINFK